MHGRFLGCTLILLSILSASLAAFGYDSEWPPAPDPINPRMSPGPGLQMGKVAIAIPAEFAAWFNHSHDVGWMTFPLWATLGDVEGENDGDLEVEESQEYGNATDRVVTYLADLAGRLKEMEYPSGLTLSYTYDDVGRPCVVNDGASDRVEDTWKGYLLEKRGYANGTYLTHLDDSSQNLSGYG